LRRLDQGVVRLAIWSALAVALSFSFYLPNILTFFSLLNGALEDNFGTAFPAFPFAALLAVIFLARWKDLHRILNEEGGWRDGLNLRAAGAVMAALPFAFISYTAGYLELSAATLILVFYGTALVVNPGSARFLFPYALLFVLGVTVPSAVENAFGEPLAGVAASLSSTMTAASGIPVVWRGTQFSLVSTVGEPLAATVTPGCSSVLSVSTFLGLLALMQLDLKRKLSSTVWLAVAGVLALTVLNSARIWVLIWVGYSEGPGAFWDLHNWIGYALFLGFYFAVLGAFSRLEPARPRGVAAMSATSIE
jgi:exosortase/archaeosortase family protein